jgi:hypothetical protein
MQRSNMTGQSITKQPAVGESHPAKPDSFTPQLIQAKDLR